MDAVKRSVRSCVTLSEAGELMQINDLQLLEEEPPPQSVPEHSVQDVLPLELM